MVSGRVNIEASCIPAASESDGRSAKKLAKISLTSSLTYSINRQAVSHIFCREMSMPGIYRPRNPQHSAYYRCVEDSPF